MKSIHQLAILAICFLTAVEAKGTNFFAPAPSGYDRHCPGQVNLTQKVSLVYESNRTTDTSQVHVTHTMKYPSVMLENIASISSVDCSSDSVAISFNDSSVFALAETAWSTEGPIVLITNHLGDCDAELERGFFLATSVAFDNTTSVVTASSTAANISSVAGMLTLKKTSTGKAKRS